MSAVAGRSALLAALGEQAAPLLQNRRAVAALLAVLVTFALFYLMHALSFLRAEFEQTDFKTVNINFVRDDEDSEARSKDRKLPQKVKKAAPPPPPAINLAANRPNLDTGGPVIGIPANQLAGFGLGALSDMDAVPLVRIEPEYPRRAAQLGLKGWVHLRFTVTTVGTTKDVMVVDSEPPRTFDRSAMRAVQKFKYRPKVVDGKPVEQYGVEIVITFDGVVEE